MKKGPIARIVIVVATLSAGPGCSSSDDTPPPGSDASMEMDSGSSQPDTGPMVDAATEAATDTGADSASGCSGDQNCSGSTPRCNVATRMCVACLSGATDNCPNDQYCDASLLTCQPGCKSNAACMPGVCSPDHVCVECLPGMNDNCPAGKYCTPQFTCALGCRNDTACTSGMCQASHDCAHCLTDLECGEGRVCSSGQCLATCTSTCPMGLTCCGDHCADLKRDVRHCVACNMPCMGNQFCSPAGCKAAVVANVCDSPIVTFLLDGLSADDSATTVMQNALAVSCAPPPTVTAVPQSSSGTIHPTNGKPVTGPGNMLVVAGGPFGQLLVKFLETTGITPVYSYYDLMVNQLRGRSPGDAGADPLIVNAKQSEVTDSHSFFMVEMVIDPASGTLVFIVYGINAAGTQAGTWYFAQKMLPARASLDKGWYVYEWTDQDADMKPGDADLFTLVASAP